MTEEPHVLAYYGMVNDPRTYQTIYPDFFRVAKGLISGNAELKGNSGDAFGKEDVEGATLQDSNIVMSRLFSGGHKVAIDLDMDAVLVPTSTPGHHHLIIDKQITWDEYKRLLEVLKDVGLIEPGFYKSALAREATVLRTPWTKKDKK